MVPIRPVLGWPPVGDRLERSLGVSRRLLLPSLNVGFALQDHEMAVYGISQDLGAVNTEGVRPMLDRGRILIGHTKAEHRHTIENIAYDTTGALVALSASGHESKSVTEATRSRLAMVLFAPALLPTPLIG
jgi:hypothetical protein